MEITMSERELDRLTILRNVVDGRITRVKASTLLELSTRQISRLLKSLHEDGPIGLVSKRRGKASNRSFSEVFKASILSIIDKDYYDYGATMISEKLLEHHGLKLGKETLRRWLVSSGRRKNKKVKEKKIRQLRARRDCFGELIQIDGSEHDWFEGRRGKCTLLVFIDDATSKIVNLRFVESESTHNYFAAFKDYLLDYGKPRAIYTDKHNVFKVNVPGGNKTSGLTQFGRALKELAVKAIFAHSPEAKGRVERANRTLQDRLIKELRYYGIATIQEANQFLKKHYLDEYNNKFSISPKNPWDLHTTLTPREVFKLDNTLSIQTTRTVTNQLIIKHHNIDYMLINIGKGHRLKGQRVTICEKENGEVSIIYKGKQLEYKINSTARYKPTFADRKSIDKKLNHYYFLLHSKISAKEQQTTGINDYPSKDISNGQK
jgi:hypothetical protein